MFLTRTFVLIGLVLVLTAEGWTTVGATGRSPLQTQPTLARLSFWVQPSRMPEFETAYKTKVVPILKRHGLMESAERGRATPDSIFSRLFELKTPTEVEEKQKALQGDATWSAMLRSLGAAFGIVRPDSLTRFAFGLYATPAGPGKTVSAGPGTGNWRTYDATDGLGSATVRSILQDREGHLWFGTLGGVSRYDGRSFTTFTSKDGLVNNYVGSICQDREGHLWFGTQGGGVSRYDGQRFTTFTQKDGLAGNTVHSIFQDREGHLWFGTSGGGVSRYDWKTFTTFTNKNGLAGNNVRSILQDREEVLWFATEGGVSRYDGKTFTTFTTKDGLPGNSVSSICQDREGHLWFGTWDGGVSRYDGKTFTTFTTKDGLASKDVQLIFEDREGNLWFGTLNDGVSRYDGKSPSTSSVPALPVLSTVEGSETKGQRFTTFTIRDGLPGNNVLSICQDREGHLWFSTVGGGVSRYDGKSFTTFTTQDGLAGNRVWSSIQDREGHLWFGTDGGGVSRYDGKSFTTFTTQDGLGNVVRSIFQDREGVLWFGTLDGGVSRYDGKIFTTFTFKDGLASNYAESIFQDREGHLWFGTFDSGVSRYDGQKFTTFTTRGGLASNWVRSILQDREGHLWFGTFGGGATCYDGKTFTAFTAEDGLGSNGVMSIFQDREGHLWFSTNGGVSRYDGQTFQTLTRQDGLASNGVYSIFQDREGYLWFGTLGGDVTRYRPPAPLPPPAFIDAVVADRRYEKVSDLAIPSSIKMTAFEFHAMSFKTRPDGMVYRYRLKGYDKDWKTTHARRVEYSDLPRGTYTFEVQAVDRDLVYSEKPATVTLRIHLPYMLVGLWSALSIAVALVAWQTARVVRRDRRLREANTALSAANKDLFGLNRELQQTLKEKEEAQQQLIQAERMAAVGELVAGSAHELNNPMAVASSLMQSTVEILKEDTPEELAQDRDMVIQNLQVGLKDLNRAKDIVASLLSLSDRTTSYTEAVQVNIVADDALRMLKGRYDEAKVQIVKDYAENLPPVTGSFADLGQMAMHLVRNAVEAIRGSGTIILRTAMEDGQVVFECRDTGAGIPPEIRGDIFKPFFKTKPPAEGTGLGLYICREVVEKHRGTISVESEVGKGTTFKIMLSVTK